MASGVVAVLPTGWADLQALTLLAALIMTGLVCILMGCGIPTTANYIIMVTVAAPTLVLLGVQPIVAHFFVFYYGVLADITPPVALAAYAAAGMAGSDPFKTGNTAFRLGLGKALVPFVFVFAPSLLIVVKGFSWYGVLRRVRRLPARHHVPGGGAVELFPAADAHVGALAVRVVRGADDRAGDHEHPDRRGDGDSGRAAAGRRDAPGPCPPPDPARPAGPWLLTSVGLPAGAQMPATDGS